MRAIHQPLRGIVEQAAVVVCSVSGRWCSLAVTLGVLCGWLNVLVGVACLVGGWVLGMTPALEGGLLAVQFGLGLFGTAALEFSAAAVIVGLSLRAPGRE